MIGCPVPGSSLGSSMFSKSKGHEVAVNDVVHMSNNFNVVNNCQQGVNVSSVTPESGEVLYMDHNTECSDSIVKHVTRCFYRSDLDKKEIKGLIAKGNKTKALGLSSGDKVVRSRIFLATKTPDNRQNQGILTPGKDTFSNLRVGSPVPSTTETSPQGGGNSNILGVPIVTDQKGVNLNSHPPIVGQDECMAVNGEELNNESIIPVQRFVEVDKHSGDTFTRTMNLNSMECRGGVTNTGFSDLVKVFDINATNDDKFTAGLFSNSVSRQILNQKYIQYDAFRCWEMQTDFHFGFIPLSDLLLPHSKIIGPGFESPIEQHYQAKKYGVPNFLGARITIKCVSLGRYA